ncbi:hypothetical protein DPEC_G00364540 [Dallia pectoralis]|nr:hypothetical protein DPEC_G00364540 [Dallia pectoralis]
MVVQAFDTLLGKRHISPISPGWYSVTHTSIMPGVSFYDHVTNTKALVKVYNWTISRDLTVADNRTLLKLHCVHQPHSITVLVSGAVTKMLTVQCREPQRIYDLLRKNGLTCSSVWDSTIALSTRAPCTALCDHYMSIVNVNRIPESDDFGKEPAVPNLYHQMKHVQVQSLYSALRYRPYDRPSRVPRPVPSLPSHQLPFQGVNKNILTKTTVIPVALYYQNPMSLLSDVIKADGRFLPSVQCVAGPETVATDMFILEVEQGNNLLITGKEQAERPDDKAEDVNPFTCQCCYDTADTYLNCGHLCCANCMPQLNRNAGCGLCRVKITRHTPIRQMPCVH